MHRTSYVQEFGAATADAPIRAILVFTDPDDWSRDLQMCFDVIQHNGVLLGSRVNSSESGACCSCLMAAVAALPVMGGQIDTVHVC